MISVLFLNKIFIVRSVVKVIGMFVNIVFLKY